MKFCTAIASDVSRKAPSGDKEGNPLTKPNLVRTPQRTFLDTIPGWEELNPKEQELVRSETHALGEELYFARKSRSAIGKHLVALRAVLEPKKMWSPLLHNGFNMSKSTAYNYINEYLVLSQKLTPVFVEIALRRGLNLNPVVIDANPPPKTEDATEIMSYLQKIQSIRPEASGHDPKPEDILRECVKIVLTRYGRLHKRSRAKFIQDFVSMLLARTGMSGPQTFTPESVPDKVAVFRSRVKTKVA